MEHFTIEYLIAYYYQIPGNGVGGRLHIVLDDGNIEHSNIWGCREICENEGDTLGMFICEHLMAIPESKLEEMYERSWGMKTH